MADSTTQGVQYNPAWASYGVSQDLWGQLNATQQAMISVGMTSTLNSYAQNATVLSIQDATNEALKDPAIVQKYADAYGIDKQAFQQSLTALGTQLNTDTQTQKQQFESDRKALASEYASAGAAYSGFRGKAQQNLANTESGVITSSRSQTQQKLDTLTSEFEQKYGTSALPPSTLQTKNAFNDAGVSISGQVTPQNPSQNTDTISGNAAGGITGTNVLAKEADVNAEAARNITVSTPVPTKGITA